MQVFTVKGWTLLFLFFSISHFTRAQDDTTRISLEDSVFQQQLLEMIRLDSSLNYEKGAVEISRANVLLNIPDNFKFLNAEQSQMILEDIWGNLKDPSVLGMLVPDTLSLVFSENAWAFIITYDNIGYVDDKDAHSIDYDELLEQLKEDSKLSNEQRRMQNLPELTLVGWASEPYYDEDRKVLHWAKEYMSEGVSGLNYDVRVLGRKGVLSLNAVGSMDQLAIIDQEIPAVLTMVEFKEGQRYSDFNPSVDQVAAYTIGGLVAGKVLTKVGFFAILAKYFKFILIGIAALGGMIYRFVTGRKKEKSRDLEQPES